MDVFVLSPQGYEGVEGTQFPFWVGGTTPPMGVISVVCSKATEDTDDVYTWKYIRADATEQEIIVQRIKHTPGVTFTPSVSADGVISWTNDGGLENPAPVSIKGPKGDPGDPGPAGPTPNITATATVNDTTGTPAVTVSKTGTDEAPVLAFEFSNIKGRDGKDGKDGSNGANGEPGPIGPTPNITATATVSNTTGTPAVTVTKSGTDAAPKFAFAFSGLKGESGGGSSNIPYTGNISNLSGTLSSNWQTFSSFHKITITSAVKKGDLIKIRTPIIAEYSDFGQHGFFATVTGMGFNILQSTFTGYAEKQSSGATNSTSGALEILAIAKQDTSNIDFKIYIRDADNINTNWKGLQTPISSFTQCDLIPFGG